MKPPNTIAIKTPIDLLEDLPAGWKAGEWPQRITDNDLLEKVYDLHDNKSDWDEGDLRERILKFDDYTLRRIPLDQINQNEWSVCEILAAEYATNETSFPPIVYDAELKSIIDGTHRVNAALLRGDLDIWAYVGGDFQE